MNPLDRAFLKLKSLENDHIPPQQCTEVVADSSRESELKGLDVLFNDRVQWPSLIETMVDFGVEHFESLGERLIDHARNGQKRIAIMSCRRGEGRTTLALAVARWITAYRDDMKLLLADADFSRLGLQHGVQELEENSRFSTWKSRLDSGGHAEEMRGMFALLRPDEMIEYRESPDKALEKLLAEYSDYFDLVLVDTAPACEADHFEGIPRLVDGALWIRDSVQTSEDELLAMQHEVHAKDLGLVGIVENFTHPDEIESGDQVGPSSTEPEETEMDRDRTASPIMIDPPENPISPGIRRKGHEIRSAWRRLARSQEPSS